MLGYSRFRSRPPRITAMTVSLSAAAALPSEIVQSPLPRLKITEIFTSLQGEADTTGCPLRCSYCDTAYAFHGGTWWDIDAIVAEVLAQGVHHVCVTGGEPLAQKRCLVLLEKLCDAGLDVSLETSGALDVSAVDPRVSRVVDLKTPGSGEMARNLLDNLPLLTRRDQIKFVLCSREDYDWARGMVAEHRLNERSMVLFSPSKGQVSPRELADWIVADRLPVRFQMQLHKILWDDEPGR
jgi:7-carboxy-7-deazaguanine synthase